MLNRRSVLATGALAAIPLAAPVGALAQNRKDAVVLAMTLEPPGLDPTAGAASAIAEIVQYNIFETLTKINSDGSVSPLLAESWEVSPDLKTYTFKLRKGVKFQNGEPFNAAAVKFSFDRAGGEKSTNKDKRTFANLTTQVVDEHTVVVLNKDIDPDLLFVLGQATAIIVEPKSADTNATKPVGTGPTSWAWNKGFGADAWDGFRSKHHRCAAPPSASSPTLLRRWPPCWRATWTPSPASRRAACRSSRPTRAFRCWSAARAPRPSWPSTTPKAAGRRARAPRHRRRHRPQGRDRGRGDGYGVPIGSHYVPARLAMWTPRASIRSTLKRPRSCWPKRHQDPAGADADPAAHAVCAPGRRGHAAQLAKVGIVAKTAERGMGAVAQRHLPTRTTT
jgi:peptide/nickel transport system substrate-binding protein